MLLFILCNAIIGYVCFHYNPVPVFRTLDASFTQGLFLHIEDKVRVEVLSVDTGFEV